MARLRLMTAGESHGPALVAILEGLPHGLRVDEAAVNADLKRRQGGYGRGGRMKIEKDTVQVLAGLRGGVTLGAPLAMMVPNADFANWTDVMHPFTPPSGERAKALTRPRPGHADLAGALKLGLHDARDVLERSSARSTTARVAAGAVCKSLLSACGIEMMCHVTRIAEAVAPPLPASDDASLRRARDAAEASDVRCVDERAGQQMIDAIKAAQKEGDSVGGVVEVVAWNVPPGLGSHVEWSERLDGRIAMALMSIQAMKGVEIGAGFAAAATRGSQLFDPILHDGKRFVRPTNNMGGVEGGITNGEPVVVRAAMKPIPTLARPLPSVDLATKQPFDAQKERTDSCAVPAAAVVAEAALAFVLADALVDKLGGDTMDELLRSLEGYRADLAEY
ncbi:MAG TPA: chorismate synthase [Polyangia bacterium]